MFSSREVVKIVRLHLMYLLIIVFSGSKCEIFQPIDSAIHIPEGDIPNLPLPTEIGSKNATVVTLIGPTDSNGKPQNREDSQNTLVIPLDSNHLESHGLTRSKPRPAPNRDIGEFVLEGGGKLTTSSINGVDNASTVGERHQTGSKGRKGVKYPGPSVVARKGVETQQILNISSVTVSSSPDSQTPEENSAMTHTSSEKLELESNSKPLQPELAFKNKSRPKSPHAKKPEVVFDAGDVDDFDKYPIIKSSTTGEDYVIIGIVIVIGIWFSVFGALLFYRRAGEYWDRRHYRRMDFLVEGMYND